MKNPSAVQASSTAETRGIIILDMRGTLVSSNTSVIKTSEKKLGQADKPVNLGYAVYPGDDLPSGHEFSGTIIVGGQATVEILKTLQNNNYKIVLATGDGPQLTKPTSDELARQGIRLDLVYNFYELWHDLGLTEVGAHYISKARDMKKGALARGEISETELLDYAKGEEACATHSKPDFYDYIIKRFMGVANETTRQQVHIFDDGFASHVKNEAGTGTMYEKALANGYQRSVLHIVSENTPDTLLEPLQVLCAELRAAQAASPAVTAPSTPHRAALASAVTARAANEKKIIRFSKQDGSGHGRHLEVPTNIDLNGLTQMVATAFNMPPESVKIFDQGRVLTTNELVSRAMELPASDIAFSVVAIGPQAAQGNPHTAAVGPVTPSPSSAVQAASAVAKPAQTINTITVLSHIEGIDPTKTLDVDPNITLEELKQQICFAFDCAESIDSIDIMRNETEIEDDKALSTALKTQNIVLTIQSKENTKQAAVTAATPKVTPPASQTMQSITVRMHNQWKILQVAKDTTLEAFKQQLSREFQIDIKSQSIVEGLKEIETDHALWVALQNPNLQLMLQPKQTQAQAGIPAVLQSLGSWGTMPTATSPKTAPVTAGNGQTTKTILFMGLKNHGQHITIPTNITLKGLKVILSSNFNIPSESLNISCNGRILLNDAVVSQTISEVDRLHVMDTSFPKMSESTRRECENYRDTLQKQVGEGLFSTGKIQINCIGHSKKVDKLNFLNRLLAADSETGCSAAISTVKKEFSAKLDTILEKGSQTLRLFQLVEREALAMTAEATSTAAKKP